MKAGELFLLKYFKNFKDQGLKRSLEGNELKGIKIIAAVLSLYQIYNMFSTMQPMLHYSIHLTFMLVLAYMLYTPHQESNTNKVSKADYVFAIVALIAGVYYISQVGHYLTRWPQVDPLSPLDIIAGILIVFFVIEATKRAIGVILPVIAMVFLLYAFFGHNLPGVLQHRYILPIDVLDQLAFTNNGIFSSPLAAASTYVFLFVLFGSFFANSGAGDFFFEFSQAIAGKYTGGAGKVAIVTSALFGTINGSPTANVVTTGSFTIPMMKQIGYSPLFSGAVSAVASTGGGILPPIMGTAAFLMVEMAGIPYKDIALAAALPGLLFYLALGFMVHFRAKKIDLKGIDPEDLPDVKKTLKEGWHFLLPLVVLVVMLMRGYTASLAAFAGIVAVILASWVKKESRMGPKKIFDSLAQGALQSVIITLSCAIAGVVINGLMITGLAGKVASLILSVGGGNLLIALLLTAVLCIILGMGMPVAAAYALTASLAIPSLYELGIEPMAAHLFVVYFSTLSAITPPVAVAAYAAAGLADAESSKIGWAACRLGIVSFIVPFMFVFEPKMLIGVGNIDFGTIIVAVTSIIGVYSLAAGLEGWILKKVPMVLRVVLFVSGLLMMYPDPITDIIGIGAFVAIIILQIIQTKAIKNSVVE